MSLTPAEITYLAEQHLGRLATIQPDGSPQVKPVGFSWNPALGTIDIYGYNMASSQKFRNVSRDGRVAFVVDDIASTDPWRVRFLEVRGTAEAVTATGDDGDASVIRIHPSRVLSIGVESPPGDAHSSQLLTRTIG